MNNLARIAFRALAASVILLPWNASAGGQAKKEAPPAKEPTVMERKLKHAQGLLGGLALKDFDVIAQEADALIRVRSEVTWRINETEQYLRHSNAFLDQLQSIKKAAKNRNIDGATLAYVDMTMTCVKCHEELRRQRTKYKDD